MKKLVLDLDSLQVNSFDTAAPQEEARGKAEAFSLTTIGESLRDYWSLFVC